VSDTATVQVDRVHYPVSALGPGRRLGVWVQGCTLACPGCMSRHTWDPGGGRAVEIRAVEAAWRAALDAGADGVTISGGEPLEQPHLDALLAALGTVRDRIRPAADILLYTGYSERAARRRRPAALATADAVITGRYLADRPTELIWRGSANQRLIPLTARGTARYTPYLDHVPARPPMQVGRDGAEVFLIGVPRPGDLARLGAATERAGIGPYRSTWTKEQS
jgi:anaerobic ribonucleoside-triphosphate reductase activating protein